MKTNQDKNIYIIGAGVSGLIAAQNLEQKGYAPTILGPQAILEVG